PGGAGAPLDGPAGAPPAVGSPPPPGPRAAGSRAGSRGGGPRQLARDDLRQRRLAEARRPVEQQVVHGLAASSRRLDEDGEVRPRLGLTGEVLEMLPAQPPPWRVLLHRLRADGRAGLS